MKDWIATCSTCGQQLDVKASAQPPYFAPAPSHDLPDQPGTPCVGSGKSVIVKER